eukprot:2392501-Amphidinium_carterae.1
MSGIVVERGYKARCLAVADAAGCRYARPSECGVNVSVGCGGVVVFFHGHGLDVREYPHGAGEAYADVLDGFLSRTKFLSACRAGGACDPEGNGWYDAMSSAVRGEGFLVLIPLATDVADEVLVRGW